MHTLTLIQLHWTGTFTHVHIYNIIVLITLKMQTLLEVEYPNKTRTLTYIFSENAKNPRTSKHVHMCTPTITTEEIFLEREKLKREKDLKRSRERRES